MINWWNSINERLQGFFQKAGPYIIFFLAVAGFFGCVSGMRKIRKMRSWPRTQGKFLEREVGVAQMSSSGSRQLFQPRVKYTYSVSGVQYTGTKFEFINQGRSEKWAQKVLDQIPTEPMVLYNPNKPEEAYLKVSGLGWIWLGLIISFFMFFIGLLLILSGTHVTLE